MSIFEEHGEPLIPCHICRKTDIRPQPTPPVDVSGYCWMNCNVDPDQTSHSDLGLHYLLRPVFSKT